jgi:hypothetical protein
MVVAVTLVQKQRPWLWVRECACGYASYKCVYDRDTRIATMAMSRGCDCGCGSGRGDDSVDMTMAVVQMGVTVTLAQKQRPRLWV